MTGKLVQIEMTESGGSTYSEGHICSACNKYHDTADWHKKGTIHGYETVRVRRFKGLDALGKKIYGRWRTIIKDKHNLLTNAGRDYFHAQDYTNTSAGGRGSGFVALTETAVTPAAGDTTLSGEITTNGLARADATTKTHTGGTNSTTIQHTFTASGAFSTVQASALFTASSAGTMTHENTFTSTALASGDQIQITWTLNLG